MGILQLIVLIAVLGMIVWFITTYIPMVAPFKTLIIAIAIIAVVFYILSLFGMFPNLNIIRIGR